MLQDGIAAPGACQLGMLQRQDLAAHPLVQQVLEAPELYQLMEALMQVCCCNMLILLRLPSDWNITHHEINRSASWDRRTPFQVADQSCL